jgi:hypothetical protein
VKVKKADKSRDLLRLKAEALGDEFYPNRFIVEKKMVEMVGLPEGF